MRPCRNWITLALGDIFNKFFPCNITLLLPVPGRVWRGGKDTPSWIAKLSYLYHNYYYKVEVITASKDNITNQISFSHIYVTCLTSHIRHMSIKLSAHIVQNYVQTQCITFKQSASNRIFVHIIIRQIFRLTNSLNIDINRVNNSNIIEAPSVDEITVYLLSDSCSEYLNFIYALCLY